MGIASGYEAPAVQRAFQLLTAVAESDKGLCLTELSKKLGISKSTAHGLIQALLKVGALNQHPVHHRFFLGSSIFELAMNNRSYHEIRIKSQPLLDDLRDRVNETVILGVLEHSKGVIIATAEAQKPLHIATQPGTTIPILAGALGKVYLAEMSNKEAAHFLENHPLPRYTKNSIIDPQEYIKTLTIIRETGCAWDQEEYILGVNAVATGIGNINGLTLALWVVSFSGILNEDQQQFVCRELLDLAESLKQRLY